MARRIVLLRGVNLRDRNRVAMPRLREALTEAGFAHVRTIVQSGNIVLDGTGDPVAAVAAVVRDEFGVSCAIVCGRRRIHNSTLARQLTDKRLGVTATARSWATVTKLLALARED